jgi:hypothetical protein
VICKYAARTLLSGALLAASCAPAWAQKKQDVPVIDTEDATLGSAKVAPGRLRPMGSVDVRNGDYARGAYDDDNADLGRLPVHMAVGFAMLLRKNGEGDGSLFLIGQSSNGFHAPRSQERRSPRSWYESNSIVAVAARPALGLTTALAYAVKASPNGIASTTHEASVSMRYVTQSGVGWWRPTGVVTRRAKGDRGVFTLLGISPEVEAGAFTLSFPLSMGVGWGGFYGPATGDRAYASVGGSVDRQLTRHVSISAQLVTLVRDSRLAALDRPRGSDAQVVPVFTLALTVR